MDQSRRVVSIGMPVYNGERFIREALDSLLSQTFTDFELIISDNASTDSTERICRIYAEQDPRIRYIRQNENLGALPNFQFVLNEAKAEYFMWAACDDQWDSNWIEQLQVTLKETGGGAAFGQVMPIDEYSQPICHVATGSSFKFQGARLIRKVKYYLAYEGAGKANLFYSLFRKCILEDISLPRYVYDYHVIFDLLNKTEISSVYGISLYKRIHAESMAEVNGESRSILSKSLWRLIFPVEPKILSDYLRLSAGLENLVLLLVMPLKYMLAYVYLIRRVTQNIFSVK